MTTDADGGLWSGWDAGYPAGLRRLTAAQQVAGAIRRMIFEGKLPAGDRLRQDEIADQLGVSRIAVREAVIALDLEGWVQTQPHRGTYVIGLDENTIRDHYEILGRFYGFAARRAAERGEPSDVAGLAELHDGLQAKSDPDEFWMANTAFALRLLTIARSRRMVAVARVLTSTVVPGNFYAEIPQAMAVQKRDLRAVLAAIQGGDGEAAERELLGTFRRAADNAVVLLAGRGLVGE
jgi:DNA-binding GntR family transcriptional regulator